MKNFTIYYTDETEEEWSISIHAKDEESAKNQFYDKYRDELGDYGDIKTIEEWEVA